MLLNNYKINIKINLVENVSHASIIINSIRLHSLMYVKCVHFNQLSRTHEYTYTYIHVNDNFSS